MPAPSQSPAPLDLAQFGGFTPGPWSALPEDRYKGSIWIEVRRDGYKTGIAEVMLTPAEAHGGTKKANALLIAAAPSLLAECQRQRAEIARLREALNELSEYLRGADIIIHRGSRDSRGNAGQSCYSAARLEETARAALSAHVSEGSRRP